MKSSPEVKFEIRKLMDCPPNGAGGTMTYEETLRRFIEPGDLKLLAKMLSKRIKLEFEGRKISFEVVKKSEVEGVVRL